MDWKEILNWGPSQVTELRMIAYTYVRQGGFAIARDLFNMIRVLEPGQAYEVQMLGAMALEEGNPKEALQWLDQALALDPDSISTRLNRAKALLQIGQVSEGLLAVKDLSRVADPKISGDAQALYIAYSRK